MKAGNFTGISGFPNQDVAMWVTMGPIADRSNDRLGASDLAIVEFRRQMLDAVKAFQGGATGHRHGQGRCRAEPSARSRQSFRKRPTGATTRQDTSGPAGRRQPELSEPSYSVKA
jgi:phthalate 4,5-dioxygenase oxygenase subunit